MRKPLRIFLFLLLTALISKGQTVYFNNVNDWGNSTSKFAYSILPVDSGYLVAGQVINETQGDWDAGILKTDLLGNTLWKKYYHWASTNIYVGRKSMIPTNDGNFVICGGKWDTSGTDAYLMKFDNNGDSLWMKTYGGDSSFSFNNVKQTVDGGFILSGITDSVSYHPDWLIMKTDSLGNTQWIKVIVPGTDYDDARVVETTHDGGYIIGGIKYIGNEDYGYIVKIDSSGNQQWKLTIGGVYGGQINDIKQTSDNNFVVCGQVCDYYNPGWMVSYGQCYIAKISSSGSIQWQKKYGSSGYNSFLSSIQYVSDGYVFAGNVGDILNSAADGFILKTDFAGDSIWARIYNRSGNDNQDMLEDIKSTDDGGFIAGGWFFPLYQKMWMLKLDSFGCDSVDCQSVGIEESPISRMLQPEAYPNPFSLTTTIIYNLPEEIPKAVLEIFDFTGRKIKSYEVNNKETFLVINAEELEKGICIATLCIDGAIISQKKLIIVK